MKKYKAFTIEEQFEGKVKRLSIHIQDAGIPDDTDNNKIVQSATIFGTIQVYIKENKEKVRNINFSLPLNDNEDLKNHLVSLMTQVVFLKEKQKKVKK